MKCRHIKSNNPEHNYFYRDTLLIAKKANTIFLQDRRENSISLFSFLVDLFNQKLPTIDSYQDYLFQLHEHQV